MITQRNSLIRDTIGRASHQNLLVDWTQGLGERGKVLDEEMGKRTICRDGRVGAGSKGIQMS